MPFVQDSPLLDLANPWKGTCVYRSVVRDCARMYSGKRFRAKALKKRDRVQKQQLIREMVTCEQKTSLKQ